MRICIMTSGNRGIGSYCLNLYRYLKKQGHDLLFISEVPWIKENIPDLYQARSIMAFGLAPVVYKPWGISKAIKDFSPDIIHYHWPSGTMDVLFRMIRRSDVPILVTLHVAIASRKQLFDKLWYVHFGLFKHHLRKVQAVNSISRFVQAQLRQRIDLPESRHALIYAGVNTEVFCPVKRKASKNLRLLFVGQVMPEKGIDALIHAVKNLPSVELSIVGNGHLMPSLQKETEGHPNIIWKGFQKDQKSIAGLYSDSDLTVLPTRWDEAFSLVPVESIACGTPVMATRLGGTPELVFPKKTGYLIDSCDTETIRQAIKGIDRKELKAMRKHCRALAEKEYSLENMGARHVELYKTLVKEYRR